MEESLLPIVRGNRIYLSAKKGIGIERLLEMMEDALKDRFREGEFLFPYSMGAAVSYLNETAVVYSSEYIEDGVKIHAKLKAEDYGRFRKYLS